MNKDTAQRARSFSHVEWNTTEQIHVHTIYSEFGKLYYTQEDVFIEIKHHHILNDNSQLCLTQRLWMDLETYQWIDITLFSVTIGCFDFTAVQ